jgi:hypothetical protein
MNDTIKNNSIYFNLTKSKEQRYAKEVVPQPTSNDIKAGFYTRYFVSRKNINNAIIEVDEKQYNKFLDSMFYNAFSVVWKLPSMTYENMLENMNTINSMNISYSGFYQKMRPFAMLPTKML